MASHWPVFSELNELSSSTSLLYAISQEGVTMEQLIGLTEACVSQA